MRDALAEDPQPPPADEELGSADLHLEDREYELAQACDGTLANMDEDHPRFQEVSNNAKSLTELVEQLMVIVRNDSLRDICNEDEDARYARMEEIIEGLRIAQEAAAAEAEHSLRKRWRRAWPCREPRRRSGLTTPRCGTRVGLTS